MVKMLGRSVDVVGWDARLRGTWVPLPGGGGGGIRVGVSASGVEWVCWAGGAAAFRRMCARFDAEAARAAGVKR
jgi:hypothetical protein